ncbi:MAG: hypothetical protein DMG23_10560 [Acidobacteria bacterium]|nr:MAG: hypothetical protein DMG23_10560 [Acidobacteriota bacterium]
MVAGCPLAATDALEEDSGGPLRRASRLGALALVQGRRPIRFLNLAKVDSRPGISSQIEFAQIFVPRSKGGTEWIGGIS